MAFYAKDVAYTRMFKMIDSADHISKKTGLTCTVNISKAGAAFGAAGGVVSEVANGWYKVALTTTDTNTGGDLAFYITAAGADDTDFVDQLFSGAISVLGVNVVNWSGAAVPAPITAGVPLVEWTPSPAELTGTATASGPASLTLGASASATSDFYVGMTIHITSGTGKGQSRMIVGYSTGRVATVSPAWTTTPGATATYIIFPNSSIQLRAQGRATSGSTTTLVDAGRAEADDFWKDCLLVIGSGDDFLYTRLITASVSATGVITFTPAMVNPITTHSYVILSAGSVDARLWMGSAPNALIAGRVDSNMQAVAAGAITAAAIATGAVDADALASDAVAEIRDSILSDSTPFAGASIAAIKAKTDLIIAGLQKNVAFAGFQIFMVSATNPSLPTGLEGLAVAGGKLRKGLDTLFVPLDNPVTELDAGLYQVDLTANDLNADIVTLGFVATGAQTRTITLIMKP